MDISGPIRETLQRTVQVVAPEGINDPLALLVQLVAVRDHPPVGVPGFLRDGAGAMAMGAAKGRAVYGHLAMAASVRLIPLVSRFYRDPTAAALRPRFEALVPVAEKLLVSRATTAAEFLWHFWLLTLARERLGVKPGEMLMKGLWRRGWGGQSKEGFLHARNAAVTEEIAAYDDLCALHAAYNAIVLTRDLDKLEPLERLVRWHVAHTQPGHVTHEPWGLAAFAALDDSGYARRQLDVAAAELPGSGIVLQGLLADALLTQEEIAAG